jgi:thymidylate synthase (FAD)
MRMSEMNVEIIDHMGSDASVVNAARVSFDKEVTDEDYEYCTHFEYNPNSNGMYVYANGDKTEHDSRLTERNVKLINYLAKHKHWTPFAHAFLSFRIKAPIFVARQLVKHQVGLAWNEVSRRYVDSEPEFWFPEVWRGKPVNAKQGSQGVMDNQAVYNDWFKAVTADTLRAYTTAIADGMAPEQARMILPQNTMTEWIWSGSLAAFARVCKLRLDPHAQQETQEIAQHIARWAENRFPLSFKALMEN